VPDPDILLILCPPWDIKMPPLGIAYLASDLKKQGFRPLIFDMNITLFHAVSRENKKWWESEKYDFWFDETLFSKIRPFFDSFIDEYVNAILALKTKIIGFSIHASNRLITVEVAKRIKQKDKDKIFIYGGWGCCNDGMRRVIPLELVDFFVIGEGEDILAELLEALRTGKAIEDIPRVIIQKDGYLSEYKSSPPVEALDSLAFPTYDEFYLNQYIDHAIALFTSRGCIGKCSFCNDYAMTHPYRYRSAEHIFKEIEYHIQHNNIRDFAIKDLLCNGNTKQLNLLCYLIIESGNRINWDAQAVSSRNLTPELLKKMKRAGCHMLIYGIESGSNKTLKKMKKLFSVEEAEMVLRSTYEAGIDTMINIIVGFPGETEGDFQQTIDFIRRNRAYLTKIGAVSILTINWNTHLHLYPEEYGVILNGSSKRRAVLWEGRDGNNYTLRRKKAEEVLRLLSELSLSHECSNFDPDKKADIYFKESR